MNRSDLQYYLDADRISLGVVRSRPRIVGDDIWKYQRALRHYEYWLGRPKSLLSLLPRIWWHYRYHKLSIKLGFEIPPFVAGPGLSLAHRGPVIVNSHARIGRNCRIHSGVNIGAAAGGSDQAPIIGDNCYIGPGAKLFGRIEVLEGTAIGANAVVNKSFGEKNITLGGIPARVISNKSALSYVIDGAGMASKSL